MSSVALVGRSPRPFRGSSDVQSPKARGGRPAHHEPGTGPTLTAGGRTFDHLGVDGSHAPFAVRGDIDSTGALDWTSRRGAIGTRRHPELIAIVVPAHNEETHIARCLAALHRARRHVEVRHVDVRIVLVLDECTDTTAATAAPLLSLGDRLVQISDANVGTARRAGFAVALLLARQIPIDNVWFCSTDADSTVGPDWLARQVRWRALGFDGVAGTVRVDSWSQHSSRVRSRYQSHMAGLGTGPGHPHVHGASLGFSASAYTAVGGMPTIETGEDRAIWGVIGQSGYRLVAVDDLIVVTSGRRVGRAPDGFAALLAQMSSSPLPLAASPVEDISAIGVCDPR